MIQDSHEILIQDSHEILIQDSHEILIQDSHEILIQDSHEILIQDSHEILSTQNSHQNPRTLSLSRQKTVAKAQGSGILPAPSCYLFNKSKDVYDHL